jgi:hypothetical protein
LQFINRRYFWNLSTGVAIAIYQPALSLKFINRRNTVHLPNCHYRSSTRAAIAKNRPCCVRFLHASLENDKSPSNLLIYHQVDDIFIIEELFFTEMDRGTLC